LPGGDDAFDVIPPGHGDRVAGFEHDEGVGVGGGDGTDHCALTEGECQVGGIVAFLFILGDKNDGDVGAAGGGGG